jgi:23S rRNA (guanine745-N1)-methyltransferase
VRGCEERLRRCDRTFACPRGHSYDIARSGYVNLLQPQDRKSLTAGDAREAVAARARLVASGVGRTLLDAIVGQARALSLPGEPPVVVDLGCGAGDLLGLLGTTRQVAAIGVDLSTAAVETAARRFPTLTWVVANADRQVPLLSGSVALALSVHARRNPLECRRVLNPLGFLLVAVPAADDLIELREAVQGAAVRRDRADALIAEHEPHFTVIGRTTARERTRCDRVAIADLLRGTYRGERPREAERVRHLDSLDVTLASDIVVFAPRE